MLNACGAPVNFTLYEPPTVSSLSLIPTAILTLAGPGGGSVPRKVTVYVCGESEQHGLGLGVGVGVGEGAAPAGLGEGLGVGIGMGITCVLRAAESAGLAVACGPPAPPQDTVAVAPQAPA